MPKPVKRELATTAYIGVDPGKSGGLVAIRVNHIIPSVPIVCPMPTTERDVWNWFGWFHDVPSVAVIEKVHSMPKQGVVSTFTFGVGYGGLRMAMIAASIPFEEITPRTWQKALGIPKREPHDRTREIQIKKGKKKGQWKVERYGGETDAQWKNRLKAKAQQLFPKVEVTLAIADALLIAEYCHRKHEGRL